MYGGGLLSLVDVAPAAFIGTLCRTVPAFIATTDVQGTIRHGFLPSLAALLGHGSLDEGNEEHRFAALLTTGTPLAHALASHWTALQGEVGDSVAGPLREPARAAGAGCAKVQRSL